MELKKLRFRGTFRDYQQRVLDNADTYLKDGKIHIVAAPGSGKTVLGLELICRIGKPCIILSPTSAIREQWGIRLQESFLENKNEFSSLFSTDLRAVRPINSITYQALHSLTEKIPSPDNNEIDYSDIDLLQLIREHGIKTICLDEAHHLKNEWQKSLEKFIKALDGKVTIIALTATPPYDSEGSEWNRYIELCGEVDEEIFVPELVAKDTLCPHQDYIYFNYPTQPELCILNEYRQNAAMALDQFSSLDYLKHFCEQLNGERDYDKLFSSAKDYIALLVFFKQCGFAVNQKLIRTLTAKRGLPAFRLQYAETAIQFLLNGNLIPEEQKEAIVAILKKYSLYEKRKVQLQLNEKLKRTLVSSVGKLNSILQIVKSEYAAMGNSLRMLILTDYIKKENVQKIATEQSFPSVNIVSIFETLRRANEGIKIGVLSGSLILLPNSTDLSFIKHTAENIDGTGYRIVNFGGTNHTSVAAVGKLFERGEIQILIGTKSLLGEGWDSPCINSLILASFVGSYVLSNQMRGRAIRIDKNNPEKTSNIWHLVTVEPNHLFQNTFPERMKAYLERDKNELLSWDFEILKRRFDSFTGPNYTTGTIESGIERITAVSPPYDESGIQKINERMLVLAADRDSVREKWKGEVANGNFEVSVESSIDREKRVPVFTFYNFALLWFLALIQITILATLARSIIPFTLPVGIAVFAAEAILLFGFYKILKKIILHGNPARSIKELGRAIYKTLQECEIISDSAKIEAKQDKELSCIHLYLRNASIHDQNIFNTAMAEFLSPIENPRYILINKNLFGKLNYACSFACPSIIGKKKEYAAVLSEKLKKSCGKFSLIYTRQHEGRKFILKCRKKSYITYNQKMISRKYKVLHWE